MRKIFTIIALAVLVIGTCQAEAQTPDTEEIVKDEMGIKRLKAVYPPPGGVVQERLVMIAADASSLESPLDPNTVTVTLDGADVTESAEITAAYVVYETPEPLSTGRHEVRITAKDVERRRIEPLSWTFTVATDVKPAATGDQVPLETQEQRDNTRGRLDVSTDYVTAEYVPQSAIDVSDLFREKEGMKLNIDLSFSNTSEGRTIIGSYHRNTQYYTDIEQDKGQLRYSDSNFSSQLGYFWLKYSDLTVLGTELGGALLEKEINSWKLAAFAGRTQDPSTSGTFKQNAGGIRGAYSWSDRNTTTLTLITAEEKYDPVFAQSANPARDRIASIRHDLAYNGNLSAYLEMAVNERQERGNAAAKDEAIKFAAQGNYTDLRGRIEVYSIGDNYLPIAEGSAKFLETDREGYLVSGDWKAAKRITAGGEYEEYDELSSDETTRRNNAFVAVSLSDTASVTYRKRKLTRNGTESQSDAVNARFTLPATSMFAETRVVAGWQDIDYSSPLALSNTVVRMLALNTSFRDILQVSLSHSVSDTSDLRNNTDTENKNFALGLNWNIIPFKLMWIGRYEISDNSGHNVDNEETRIKTTIKYVIDPVYTLNLGAEWVDYVNAESPDLDYDQAIVRSGVEWKF